MHFDEVCVPRHRAPDIKVNRIMCGCNQEAKFDAEFPARFSR
jgi:hypothetical protein